MLIGNVEIKGRLGLAPMAGVADAPFRTVCRELGAALAYTEMVSAKALVYQDGKTRQLLERGVNDYPLSVQLFGSEPEVMAEAAVKARALTGCELIDINMGCPTGKIVSNNEGCALMKDMALAERIIRAVVKACDVPVTVKIRKGWDKGSVNAVEFAQMAEAAGVSAVAVHGRTRAQLYSGSADWDIIREVKSALSVPVLATATFLSLRMRRAY
jgi:tRNA-dihydrouridine synthase B